MAEIAEAYPDEEWLQPTEQDIEAEDFDPMPWHDLYFRAFDMLMFDRFFGALGGQGRISYMAISRYADDHGIDGDDRHMFMRLMDVLDGVYLKLESERAKQTQERKEAGQA